MMTPRIPVAVATMLVWLGGPQTAWSQSDEWRTNGPAAGIINAMAIDPEVPTTIYAGTDQGGVFKSTDGGDSWFAVNDGLPGLRIFALAIDSQVTSTLYAIVRGNGIFKSLDGGGSWRAAQGGIPQSVAAGIHALAIDPQNPTTLYVGVNGDHIFKTTDGGNFWSRSGASNTQAFAIDPQTPSTIYAGTDRDLFKSSDGGVTWRALQTGLRANWVSALAIDPAAPGTVFLATRSFETSPPHHPLLKSTDGGATWSDSNSGLPESMLRAVAIDPRNPSILYVGNPGGGVFKSDDGGTTWSAMNDGLTSLYVRSLALDPQSATVYAGTESGVFARTPAPPQFTLKVSKSGIGSGTVTSSPAGIACGSDCAEPYLSATSVTLTATPALGSIFTGWSGCDVVSSRRCTLVMTAERSVSANFFGSPIGIGRSAASAAPESSALGFHKPR